MNNSPEATIHSMPRTTGTGLEIISSSGSIVARLSCHNRPRMATPYGPEKRYLDALAAGRFEIQKCSDCGKHVFYPRVLCPHCGAGDLGWVAASGRGTVYSTTVVRRKAADGGGAYVLTRAERAKDLPKPPAYLLGVGAAHWHRQISSMPDPTVTAATESRARAFAMAHLRPRDVDVLELYDAFTINTLLFLEDLGFCAKGEGGGFVAAGRIAPGGALPVNTNGGGLSCVHPGMYGIFLLVEAVRQLRGEAGARQVKDAAVALAHGNGGVLSSQITAILGTEDTL
jgi:hypothetical protein